MLFLYSFLLCTEIKKKKSAPGFRSKSIVSLAIACIIIISVNYQQIYIIILRKSWFNIKCVYGVLINEIPPRFEKKKSSHLFATVFQFHVQHTVFVTQRKQYTHEVSACVAPKKIFLCDTATLIISCTEKPHKIRRNFQHSNRARSCSLQYLWKYSPHFSSNFILS